MTQDPVLLTLLARTLSYPSAATPALLVECGAAESSTEPAAADQLRQFAEAMTGDSLETMQESFTASFDFDPKVTLDIGWHLYGENYERGDFLARMREALAAHGVEEGSELPDHLPQILLLLSKMAPDAAAELAGTSVVPALEKILAGLEGRATPYEHAVRAVQVAVSELAPVGAGEVPHV